LITQFGAIQSGPCQLFHLGVGIGAGTGEKFLEITEPAGQKLVAKRWKPLKLTRRFHVGVSEFPHFLGEHSDHRSVQRAGRSGARQQQR